MQPEQQTKVTLSPSELELVTNAEVILTKNRIIQKVYALFASLSDEYVKEATLLLTSSFISIPPKISRGENYLGLPYVMLDYPRNFTKQDTFAIRTFFWWGHFFSITVQLSGEHQHTYLPAITKAVEEEKFNGWYGCINENEWHHHFEEDNYQPLDKTFIAGVSDRSFIKIARRIPLREWESAAAFLESSFREILMILKS